MSHAFKRQKLGLFACMGGPFNRCHFILEMYGDDLNPEEISSALGLAPTKSYKKGDETPRGSQYRKTGGWFLDSNAQQLADAESGSLLFEEWISALPSDEKLWASLMARFDLRIRLAAYTDQMNAEFTLSPLAASELAKRGLPIVFDPYLKLDDDELKG